MSQEFGNLILNDAPDRIVIDTEITVYQPIARSNNHTPRNIGMYRPDIIRNMGRCLADQFEIAQRSVVIQATGFKTYLVEIMRNTCTFSAKLIMSVR